MQVIEVISHYTVILLGIGVILAANYYVWKFVIKKLLVTFKIYELLLDFVIERNRKKASEVYTPQMKRSDSE